MVHLLDYVSGQHGGVLVIEEAITIKHARVAPQLKEGRIRSVSLAPEGTLRPFSMCNGYVEVPAPRFRGYALLVYEH